MKFLGFKRKDGSVGVRNHVLILPSCACASETCRVVASQVLGTKNVIINVGCSDVTANTEMTQRVLTGFALNANVFGVVVIGLGCETVGHKELADKIRKLSDKPVVSFGIQEEGGTIKTAALAVEAARKMVEEASKQQKVECDASDLFVAIECGGSDATSGIASNPAVGNMADRIYDLGGTTMMSETVEFIGAEHVLAKHRKFTIRLFASAKTTKSILRLPDKIVAPVSRHPATKSEACRRSKKKVSAVFTRVEHVRYPRSFRKRLGPLKKAHSLWIRRDMTFLPLRAWSPEVQRLLFLQPVAVHRRDML